MWSQIVWTVVLTCVTPDYSICYQPVMCFTHNCVCHRYMVRVLGIHRCLNESYSEKQNVTAELKQSYDLELTWWPLWKYNNIRRLSVEVHIRKSAGFCMRRNAAAYKIHEIIFSNCHLVFWSSAKPWRRRRSWRPLSAQRCLVCLTHGPQRPQFLGWDTSIKIKLKMK